MSAKYGYIGNNPSDTSVVVAKQVFAPTGVQTTFTFVSGYSIGYLDVYINGARQVEGQDYNATDTSTVGLSSAAQGGDIIELVAYKAFNVATVDTIPGDLRVQGKLTVVGLTTGSNAFYSGIVTATSFVGALTGNATGLSGTPNITVGNIVGAALTLSGNLTVNGTTTIINTTNLEITDPLVGIGSGNTTDAQANGDGILIYGATNKTLTYNDTKKGFETNVAWATTETRLISVAEKLTRIDGNTASLVYNGASSNIGLCTNPSGNITLAVTGIPTDSSFDSHSISFGVMVNQTGTARSCTAVTLNGYSATIRFAGGSLSAAISGVTTTSGMDIYNFTGINTVGSASTTANYYLLGVVNGGFR